MAPRRQTFWQSGQMKHLSPEISSPHLTNMLPAEFRDFLAAKYKPHLTALKNEVQPKQLAASASPPSAIFL